MCKLAERAGFEPAIRFNPIHAFQACAFNRSATSPAAGFLEGRQLTRLALARQGGITSPAGKSVDEFA